MLFCGRSQNLLGLVSGWFNDQETSDIKVNLQNDRVVYCHRIFLRSWSPVWAAALQDEKVCSIDLCAHDARIVEIGLQFCYGFNIGLSDDNLTRVHLFAFQYNIEELQAKCEEVMTKEVSATNCLSLHCYFLKHDFPALLDAWHTVKACVRNEFAAATLSEEFPHISEEVLCEFLADEMLNAKEDDVLDACCRWLGDSPDPRVRERVLKFVRFPQLSGKKLIEFRSHPLFQPDLEARYNFATQWAMTRLAGDDQQSLRTQLASEAKGEYDDHLTPRGRCLEIQSRILDEEMAKTLLSMLGGNYRVARLLVDSSAGTGYDDAIRGQGPFVCIIKGDKGHVFGAYVENTFGKTDHYAFEGSPNNFLFSLKHVPPQKVVKLKRNVRVGNGVRLSGSLGIGERALTVFGNYHSSTADDPAFELAPGYESVGSKTLHGEFGTYTPRFIEVFAISQPLERAEPAERPKKQRRQ